MNKNEEKLNSFTEYCQAHPDERFWQALRNWAEVGFILKADLVQHGSDGENIEAARGWRDTFYEE